MTDEPGVEDGVQIGPPVRSLFGKTPEAGPLGNRNLIPIRLRAAGSGRVGHGTILPRSLVQAVRTMSAQVPSGDRW